MPFWKSFKAAFKNFAKFTEKHLSRSLIWNKITSSRPAILFQKILQHKCFPGNFAKVLRTPFSTEQLRLTASDHPKLIIVKLTTEPQKFRQLLYHCFELRTLSGKTCILARIRHYNVNQGRSTYTELTSLDLFIYIVNYFHCLFLL